MNRSKSKDWGCWLWKARQNAQGWTQPATNPSPKAKHWAAPPTGSTWDEGALLAPLLVTLLYLMLSCSHLVVQNDVWETLYMIHWEFSVIPTQFPFSPIVYELFPLEKHVEETICYCSFFLRVRPELMKVRLELIKLRNSILKFLFSDLYLKDPVAIYLFPWKKLDKLKL